MSNGCAILIGLICGYVVYRYMERTDRLKKENVK